MKWRHFYFDFDLHNYYPACREAGKGDDACVMGDRPYFLCSSFSDEQLSKIANQKRYVKKCQKSNSSKDESEVLCDPVMGDILPVQL